MFRYIRSSSFTEAEHDAIRYWKQGNNGWGFRDIRAILNGHEPSSVSNLKKLELDGRSEDVRSQLEQIAQDAFSAVMKCPKVRGQEIYRITGDYHYPKEGDILELELFTSFTKELDDRILDDFAIPEGVIYRLIATDSFRDITGIGKSSQDAESEVLSTKTMKYRVISAEMEHIGGEESWLGTIGGEDYMMVDLQPME